VETPPATTGAGTDRRGQVVCWHNDATLRVAGSDSARFAEGAWKGGYYDPASRVFAGAIDGELTTVIGNATRRYIENLMRAVP